MYVCNNEMVFSYRLSGTCSFGIFACRTDWNGSRTHKWYSCGVAETSNSYYYIRYMYNFSWYYAGVLQSSVISVLPVPLERMATTNLFSVVNSETGLGSSMPISILFLVAIYLIVGFVLKYTMLGRGIYAVGGDSVAAERAD